MTRAGRKTDGKADGAGASRNRIEVNILAALAAASMAYGTHDDDDTALPRMDVSWLVGAIGADAKPPAVAAAAYLRGHREAQPETLVIHLNRNGFAGTPFPETPFSGARIRAAWRVFALTLNELDEVDRVAKLTASPPAPRQRPAARREELANPPPDRNPLTQLGRKAQAQARARAKKD